MSIRGLNHLTLAVTNLDRSLHFYWDVLGLRLRAVWPEGAYLDAGQLWLCLSLDPAADSQAARDYTHIAFDVAEEHFPALADRLASIAPQWRKNSSEGASLYVLDPDGHRLELHVGSLESRLEHYRRTPPPGMRIIEPEDARDADIRFRLVTPESVPMALLLLADPSETQVRRYLDGALCLTAEVGNRIVGACILNRLDAYTLELFNIAVVPDVQGRGIGTALLHEAIRAARSEGACRLELSTGTFGYQLAFYQRAGFRVVGVVKDFFLTHYAEPIFEMGIRHKDQLRLALEL